MLSSHRGTSRAGRRPQPRFRERSCCGFTLHSSTRGCPARTLPARHNSQPCCQGTFSFPPSFPPSTRTRSVRQQQSPGTNVFIIFLRIVLKHHRHHTPPPPPTPPHTQALGEPKRRRRAGALSAGAAARRPGGGRLVPPLPPRPARALGVVRKRRAAPWGRTIAGRRQRQRAGGGVGARR